MPSGRDAQRSMAKAPSGRSGHAAMTEPAVPLQIGEVRDADRSAGGAMRRRARPSGRPREGGCPPAAAQSACAMRALIGEDWQSAQLVALL